MIGPPGGVFGPPGGLRAWTPPPLVTPMPLMAPMPSAAQPGGSAPPGLPDLQAVGRAAMADVLEGNAAAAAARDRLPDLIEVADRARSAAPASASAAARAAAATARTAAALPAPSATTGAVPGVWRGPPPAWQQPQRTGQIDRSSWPGAGQIDRSSWPGAEVVPRDRDRAQRVGDALYPFVRWIRESRAGWVGVIALFGITLPIILLRQDFDARLRLLLGFFSFIFWIQFLSELVPG